MYEYFTFMYVCVPCTCLVPEKVIAGCWDLNPDSLQEEQVLSAEAVLQPG